MFFHLLRRAPQLLSVLRIALQKDAPHRKQVRLVRAFIGMGGVYIKFAQLILIKTNGQGSVSRHDYSYLLKQTYDATLLEPIDVQAIVTTELGEAARDLVITDHMAIASGSFGQVYKARLTRDNREVIIKVVKPSVLRTIRYDLQILGVLARLVGMSSPGAINIVDLFGELREVIVGELDYKAEAYNAAQLHNTYKNHASLVIPQTYEHLCTKHIIVQDYIEGLALTEVVDQAARGNDAAAYVQAQTGSNLIYQMTVVGQEMLTAMLGGGVTHGDPHPGNIILLEHNRIALIDFGICTEGPSNKRAFYDLVTQYKRVYVDNQFDIEAFTMAITNLFADELMGAIHSLDRYRSGQISQRVLEAIQDGVRVMYEGAGNDIQDLVQDHKFMQIFDTVVNENNRFGLSVQIDQPAFIRATLLYISLVKSLGVKDQVLANTYGNVCKTFQDYQFAPLRPKVTSQEEAIGIIAEWLEQIASRDIFLYTILSRKIGKSVLYV